MRNAPETLDDTATGPGPTSCLANLAVAALATGLSWLAYRFPTNAVLPTLAFFLWAYLFLRAVIEFPVELGLVPPGSTDEAERHEEDEPAGD